MITLNMAKQTRIKVIAKENGMTLTELGRKLGIPRSNMSAIASGSRGVSLQVLLKILRILDCDIDDLYANDVETNAFKDKNLQACLEKIENAHYNGQDKTWVHRVMLAQNIHYRRIMRL